MPTLRFLLLFSLFGLRFSQLFYEPPRANRMEMYVGGLELQQPEMLKTKVRQSRKT